MVYLDGAAVAPDSDDAWIAWHAPEAIDATGMTDAVMEELLLAPTVAFLPLDSRSRLHPWGFL